MTGLWIALCLIGCRGDASGFDAPWASAGDTTPMLNGWFSATLGAQTPGAGWFEVPQLRAHDFVLAEVQDPGWTHPVLHVRIGGRQPAGWDLLELDVALNHWVAGEVPVDGTAAVGLLHRANGDQQFVLGGTLQVVAAGVEAGQAVEASFNGLGLTEVQP